jgi:hypothetical protein
MVYRSAGNRSRRADRLIYRRPAEKIPQGTGRGPQAHDGALPERAAVHAMGPARGPGIRGKLGQEPIIYIEQNALTTGFHPV